MKYYIVKVGAIDEKMINGIKRFDKKVEIVDNLNDCDIVVLQRGWTDSMEAIEEYNLACELHKRCNEGYIYVDEYTVRVN